MNVPTYLRYLQWQIFVFNLDFFFMVAQYQLRHKITRRILNLKYAGKKKGMGKESLTVSMETNPCIVDPINCSQ